MSCVSTVTGTKHVSTTEAIINLQNSIDKLNLRTEDWQIKFNESKCSVLHIGKKNPLSEYKLGSTILSSCDFEKDLGVFVDSNLDFEHHINETVKKANKLVGMITHFISYKVKEVMVPLYETLVRLILEYGNVVWCPKLKGSKKRIEDVRRRFTKRIIGMHELEYEERLKSLKLPTVVFFS